MMHIASWVLHSHRTDQLANQQPYRDLDEKILSHAKEFGCDDLVHYDDKLGAHFPTRVMPFIDEYAEESFWIELMDRLVERDMVRALGEKQYPALDVEERILKRGALSTNIRQRVCGARFGAAGSHHRPIDNGPQLTQET